MTMIPMLVNAGNRTKDVLKVYDAKEYEDALPERPAPIATIKRGEMLSLGAHMRKPIILTWIDGPDDEFVGQPQITVTDPPRSG